MATIDERVVSIKFNNGQFMSGIKESLAGIRALDKGLQLDNATSGIAKVADAAKNLTFGDAVRGAANVVDKMGLMEVAGIASLAGIGAKAAAVGADLVKSLTITPALEGFSEYELQLNSVQTILANTASKGETIETVNAALDELNTYADQTIYNFSEMTRNIGTFTAAGVGLKESVSAIKGLSNLAAASGSSSAQASTAMYQLSQAIAAGTVRLMDWNSVQNAGMGGEQMQEALKRTARVHGEAVDAAIAKQGSFRESLQEGWLTSEVMLETLTLMTGDLDEATIRSMGYTEEQTQEIMQFASTALDAATKIKTFTQLVDTAKEELGSGWATTWRLIIGDFQEAKDLWTAVGKFVTEEISLGAKARNDLLLGWKELGGRTELLRALYNIFRLLWDPIAAVRSGFLDVFTGPTAQGLYSFTKGVADFTEHLRMSENACDNLFRVVKGVSAVLHILWSVFSDIAQVVGFVFIRGFEAATDVIKWFMLAIGNGTGAISDLIVKFDLWYNSLDLGGKAVHVLSHAFDNLREVIIFVRNLIGAFASGIYYTLYVPVVVLRIAFKRLGEAIRGAFSKSLHAVLDPLKALVEQSQTAKAVLGALGSFFGLFSGSTENMGSALEKVQAFFDSLPDKAEAFGEKIANKLVPGVDAFTEKVQKASDKVNAFGDKLAEKISNHMPAVVGWFSEAKTSVHDLGTEMMETQGVSSKWELLKSFKLPSFSFDLPKFDFGTMGAEIKAAFASFKDMDTSNLTAFFQDLGGRLKTFVDHIKAAIGPIGEFWTALDLGGRVSRGWENFKNAYGGIPELIVKGLKAIGGALVTVIKGFAEFSNAVKEGWASLKENFQFDFTEQKIRSLGTLLAGGGIVAGILMIKKRAQEMAPMLDVVKEQIEKFGNVFSSLSENLEAHAKKTIAESVLIYAASLLVLVAAMWILAQIPADKLLVTTVALAAVFAMITSATKSMGENLKDTKDYLVGAASLVLVSFALSTAAGALAKLGDMSWGDIIKGTAALFAVMRMTTTMFGELSKQKGEVTVGLGTMIGISVGLSLISIAVRILGSMPTKVLIQGLFAMGVIMTLITMYALMGARNVTPSSALLFLSVAMSLRLVAKTIADFASMSWGEYLSGVLKMAIVLALLVAALLPFNNYVNVGAAQTLIALVASVAVAAGIIAMFAAMSWGTYLEGAIKMAATLAILIAAAKSAEGDIEGAASIFLLAAAMRMLIGPIERLAAIPVKSLGVALAAMGIALWILVKAAAGAQNYAVGLWTLGGAMALIGASAALAGLGMTLFAGGLATLAGSGAAGIAVLAKLIELIPVLGTALAQAVINILAVLAENGDIIRNALAALLIAALGAIYDALPQATQTLVALIDALCTVLVLSIPRMTGAFLDILIACMQTITDHTPELAQKASDMIIAFLQAIEDHAPDVIAQATSTMQTLAQAFSDNLPTMIQTAFDVAISFLNGFADAIRNNSQTVGDAVGNVVDAIVVGFGRFASGFGARIGPTVRSMGRAIINGMKAGARAAAQGLVNAVRSVAKNAIDAAKRLLGIASPSKVFREIGDYTIQGFAIGIARNQNAIRATANSAQSVSDTFAKGLTLKDAINDQLSDLEDPTIRPVVDLSEVNDASKAISDLGTSVPTSLGMANAVAAKLAANQEPAKPQNDDKSPRGDVIFNQYNTSPKALSEAEIYRQTRSQLVGLREEIFKL